MIYAFVCSLPFYSQQGFQFTSTLDLYQNGRELFQQKNYPAAVQSLKIFVTKHTDTDLLQEAEYMLACSSYELKEKSCIENLRRYLDKYPDSRHTDRVYSLIASAFFFEEKYDESIAMFNVCRVYNLDKEEKEQATFRLATSYLKVGQLHPASVWFETLKNSSEKYYKDCVYNLSYINYAQGKTDEALKGFLSLQDDPVYAERAPYYIGEIYLLQKEYGKATEIANSYLSRYKDNKHVPEMCRILGESYYYTNQYASATEPLAEYVNRTISPRKNIVYLLGVSYYEAKVYSGAVQVLNDITAGGDELSQSAYLYLGYSYLKMLDKNKARMAFEQAASSDFNQQIKEHALYNYALCIHETSYSAFDESVNVFERFLNTFPHSVYTSKISEYLVEVYMNTKSYEAALKSIAKISSPSAPIMEAKQKILFRLGTQSFINTDFEQAILYFNQSLSLGQYNQQTKADVYYWRGEARYRMDNFDGAIQDLSNYLKETKEKNTEMYPLAHYNLGYSYFKQKNYQTASTWFSKYVNQVVNQTVLADAYNRLGDCCFHSRNFAAARQNYALAENTGTLTGGYSLYQSALVLGLQKNYAGKAALLNQLLQKYPTSDYSDDALYERGRAYVLQGDNKQAIASFKELLKKFPESPIARKGASEIGLLYYQDDSYQEAIQAYKEVINKYSDSEEAKLALRDLKSIYIDLNKVDEFADFASSLQNGIALDITEQDSLTYIAAERIYMRSEIKEAQSSFTNYLKRFPKGAFSINAYYYLGIINYNQKKTTEALSYFEKVLGYSDNKFSEDAMILSGEILYNNKEYSKALEVYSKLKEKTSSTENRSLALTGWVRSAFFAGNQTEVINAANTLLSDTKLSPELVNEVMYYRAKAYLQQKQNKEATADLKILSKDTRNLYGAEAKYLLAELYFETGDKTLAEKEILDYIDQSTPHVYWLARSFILLSDVYVAMDRKLDAKQYLLSLKQAYTTKDDIASMIDSRLQKLNK